jgi:hypothetical protein
VIVGAFSGATGGKNKFSAREAKHEKCDCEGNQGRVGEEGSKSSPAEDGEAEIDKSRYDGDGCGHHGHQAPTILHHMSWTSPDRHSSSRSDEARDQ